MPSITTRMRQTGLVRFIKARPFLYRSAVKMWFVGRAVLRVIGSPVTILMAPFLCVVYTAVLLPRRRSPTRPEGKPLIVMLAVAEIFRDPRIEREARALAEGGYLVKILYPDTFSEAYGIGPLDWGNGVSFVPLPAHTASYVYRFPHIVGFGLLRFALKEQPYAYHAHDLITSVIALAAANWNNAHCICDFHEWYSENVTWHSHSSSYVTHSRWTKAVYRFAEGLALEHASRVVTVCESIAQGLAEIKRPKFDIRVVRNIPTISGSDDRGESEVNLRQDLGVGRDRFLLLYQGGLGPSRMLEPIIEAMALVPLALLIIRGPHIESFQEEYLDLARACGAADRVICLPPVASHDVVRAARGADAGIWTLPNLCKNFSYALPNKLFEYIAAGLPVLAANYPEARRLILSHEVGIVFDPYSPNAIACAINQLITDPDLRERFSANTAKALQQIDAKQEWQRLVSLYNGLQHT